MDEKLIKKVVESLNEDLNEKYEMYHCGGLNSFREVYDEENPNHFKAVYDDVDNKMWAITFVDIILYVQDNAIEIMPQYYDKKPFIALKEYVIIAYNEYLDRIKL